MAYKYIGFDSGRVLINGLTLKPGVIYELAEGDVRYAPGVSSIKKELADKLVQEKLIELVKEEAKAVAKPAEVKAVENVEKAA